ncbi:hypothetical protein ACFL0A_00245 [Patescibacteria group bacterium]
MEKIIGQLEKKLRDVADGKPVKPLKEEMGDEITVCFTRVVISALQWTSVGYDSALRLAGMKLGKRMGTTCEKTEFSLVLEEVKRIIRALRGGRVETEISAKLKRAQLKVYNSPFVAGIPNVLQNICFFEEGFIEGYFDGVIAKKGPIAMAGQDYSVSEVDVEEERCVGLGDDFCGFLIKF